MEVIRCLTESGFPPRMINLGEISTLSTPQAVVDHGKQKNNRLSKNAETSNS